MWLITEAFGEIPDVTAEDINRVLPADEFGCFAALFASQTKYMQTCNRGRTPLHTSATAGQLHVREWALQHGDEQSAAHGGFEAAGLVTLDHVRLAFLSFLAGGEDWRRQFTWAKVRS
jgi:hypothetical protein